MNSYFSQNNLMESDEKVEVIPVTAEEPVENTVEPKEEEVADPADEDNKDANMESEKKKKKKKKSKKKPVTGSDNDELSQ